MSGSERVLATSTSTVRCAAINRRRRFVQVHVALVAPGADGPQQPQRLGRRHEPGGAALPGSSARALGDMPGWCCSRRAAGQGRMSRSTPRHRCISRGQGVSSTGRGLRQTSRRLTWPSVGWSGRPMPRMPAATVSAWSSVAIRTRTVAGGPRRETVCTCAPRARAGAQARASMTAARAGASASPRWTLRLPVPGGRPGPPRSSRRPRCHRHWRRRAGPPSRERAARVPSRRCRPGCAAPRRPGRPRGGHGRSEWARARPASAHAGLPACPGWCQPPALLGTGGGRSPRARAPRSRRPAAARRPGFPPARPAGRGPPPLATVRTSHAPG